MSSVDPKTLAQEIVTALAGADHSRLFVPREEHAEHHEFVKALIAREKRQEERMQRIKERVIGSGVAGLALAGVGWLGKQTIYLFNVYILHK